MALLPSPTGAGGVNDNATTNAQQKSNFQNLVQWLRDAFGTSNDTATAAGLAAARAAFGANGGPFRNVVINGDQSVDPTGGAAVTFTAGAALAVGAEMFYGYCTGANVTGQRVQLADGTFRWRFTGAASNTLIGYGTRIEAANSRHLAGQTCTLSVRLRNTVVGTVNWSLAYANTEDAFGTLASPTTTAIASGSFTSVSGTEGVYTTQVVVPAAAITGLEARLTVANQTSGQWDIGEVQLELGSVPANARVFERVDRALQISRCQRYFEKSYEDATAPGTVTASGNDVVRRAAAGEGTTAFAIRFSAVKRVVPTVVWYSPGTGTAARIRNTSGSVDITVTGTSTVAPASTRSPGIPTHVSTGAVGELISAHWTADARLF
jgi:hypothetical protein